MTEFVSSGFAVDLVLGVIAIEFAALAVVSRMGRGRMGLADAFFALAPGACLLALRAAILEQGGLLIAGWIAASFPLHLIDLWRRQR